MIHNQSRKSGKQFQRTSRTTPSNQLVAYTSERCAYDSSGHRWVAQSDAELAPHLDKEWLTMPHARRHRQDGRRRARTCRHRKADHPAVVWIERWWCQRQAKSDSKKRQVEAAHRGRHLELKRQRRCLLHRPRWPLSHRRWQEHLRRHLSPPAALTRRRASSRA